MNKRIKILLYGGNLWYLGEGMLGPLFALFAQRIGGDIFDITWAWATYLILNGFLTIFVGKITNNRLSREKTMVAGYALNALCTFGYLLVSTPLHLFIVQGGLGIAAALASPTWSALYDRHSPKTSDGWLWGLAGGHAQIVTGCALLIGGMIVARYSFTTLFTIMGTIQVIATLYQARILKTR